MFDIKIEIRGSKKRPPPQQGAEHMLVVGLGREVRRRRIAGRHGPEGAPPQYRGGRRVISPRYPEARGGRRSESSGAVVFESSQSFHRAAGAKAGTGFVSGGAWQGLSLLVRGSTRSRLAFRGRSEGQDPNIRTYKSGKTKAKGKKQSNALKAATVLASQGLNLIEPTDQEVEALSFAVAELVRRDIVSELAVIDEGESQAVNAIARRVLRSVEAFERQVPRRG